ncbi:hypothetical protein CDCA_CDCA16G4277 [Cyanidium caldarium]|uniref:Dynamin-type G domain-containing protein n=1 Tax=Cyanidium caldarium TaxID=2771 RepID=A0AAV9J0Z9_CYACA|nr:hypothetical protein CDCA_CDCA16G4277 [Cyanidium caldarium]
MGAGRRAVSGSGASWAGYGSRTPLAEENGATVPLHRTAATSSSAAADASDPTLLTASSHEELYSAYNMLHALAQDFSKPFDAPAIVIVGHQTDGKSALIEALVGFQFSHVGGGTKTRRPVTLHMQYNPRCLQPVCFLKTDQGEEHRTLTEIQMYIEAENAKLEADPFRSFDPEEVVLRIEYKYCPNLTLIDTPGLISPPPPGRRTNPQQQQALRASREVEDLVLAKISRPEYIILCIEDTVDWHSATSRRLVMQVDPELARTVLVSTKLDAKLPQFALGGDLEQYLMARPVLNAHPELLGGPFYTAVPAGRVGNTREHLYESNERFRQAIARREAEDRAYIERKIGKPLPRALRDRIGVSKLRGFLEDLLQTRYMQSVPAIVPLLQSEFRNVDQALRRTVSELDSLSLSHLKDKGRVYAEEFLRKLAAVIKGTIRAPPALWGESLSDERLRGGSYHDLGSSGTNVKSAQVGGIPKLMISSHGEPHVDNQDARLFGGAQYYRALREFKAIVAEMERPPVSHEEIANAAGIDDAHDGVNYMRAACVIAVEKAKDAFDPLLDRLAIRCLHIFRRMYPIVEFILRKDNVSLDEVADKPFRMIMEQIYCEYLETVVARVQRLCHDDLESMTRFVTWNLNQPSKAALRRFLQPVAEELGSPAAIQESLYGSPVSPEQAASEAVDDFYYGQAGAGQRPSHGGSGAIGAAPASKAPSRKIERTKEGKVIVPSRMAAQEVLLQFMEDLLMNRVVTPSSMAIVSSLVDHILDAWRMHFAKVVELKFNCFFLMPVAEEFPRYCRDKLERLYAGDLNDVFDVAEARAALERQREDLMRERKRVEKLQAKFHAINAQLAGFPVGAAPLIGKEPAAHLPVPEPPRGEMYVARGGWD